MAPPRHEPTPQTRQTVETMAGFGVPVWDIAQTLKIELPTLRKYYRDELETGHIKANVKVAQNLFRIATGQGREAVTAAIFWLKTRARWSEIDPLANAALEDVGKKEQANRDALIAHKDTEWEKILN